MNSTENKMKEYRNKLEHLQTMDDVIPVKQASRYTPRER